MKKPTNIYLYANEDRTWQGIVSDDLPKEGAVFFMQEQSYPATLFHVRFDLNGSSVMEKETIQNRDELLKALNWIGKTGGLVSSLWEFDEDKEISPDLLKIFKDGMARKMERIAGLTLDEKISSAEKKIGENNDIEKITKREVQY